MTHLRRFVRILQKIPKCCFHIVGMYPVAAINCLRRISDAAAIFDHITAGGNLTDCHLVPGGNLGADSDFCAGISNGQTLQ